MGGLRRHAMRVARVLQGTEGEDAESHRVTGVAESQRIAQASRLGGGGVSLGHYLAKGCAKVTK